MNFWDAFKRGKNFLDGVGDLADVGRVNESFERDFFETLVVIFGNFELIVYLDVGVEPELDELVSLGENRKDHLNFFRPQLLLYEGQTSLHLRPKVCLLKCGPVLDLMFKLWYLSNVFLPVVDVALEPLLESIIFEIFKVIYFTSLFCFAGCVNALFHFIVNSKFNHWNVKILSALGKMHLQRGEFLDDRV